MSTGATDGLYLRNGEIPTYGVEGTFGDMDDVRAHGKDERVGVKQYFEGLEFQYRLIKELSAAGGQKRTLKRAVSSRTRRVQCAPSAEALHLAFRRRTHQARCNQMREIRSLTAGCGLSFDGGVDRAPEEEDSPQSKFPGLGPATSLKAVNRALSVSALPTENVTALVTPFTPRLVAD